MKLIIRIFNTVLIVLISLLLLLSGTAAVLYFTSDTSVPEVRIPDKIPAVVDSAGASHFGNSFLVKGEGDLWELHMKGDAAERGLAFGQLCKGLMYEQESAFVTQIKKIIPKEGYLNFLKYLTIIYNRDLRKNIPQEYLEEIYAASRGCSSEFSYIGDAYDRQLNYHAAHDLGHAMQEYMLVGCSSFAVWDTLSADSSLLVARNFDFWVGDDFARNKLVTFCYPEKGYRFASVGWAGMSGVLSGMNEKGVTVTLNAAKSVPPGASKTPVSIIAREILQYAANIDEAYTIALKLDAFVSESLLIGSAEDGKAAIIEKSPKSTILYSPEGNKIISTNHYQSPEFLADEDNKDAIAAIEGSHSQYRFRRIEELIASKQRLNSSDAASILREHRGIADTSLGLGNEMSLNQFIAHHGVVFSPAKRVMWVSTAPWQLGKMVAYDLNKIFGEEAGNSARVPDMDIPADSAAISMYAAKIMEFRLLASEISRDISNKSEVKESDINRLIELNPDYFYTYKLLGDYYSSAGNESKALSMFEKALTKEIPSYGERESLEERIKRYKR
ncbi:MAG: choloylglycine hydrolase [Bacteroidetes bacterium HGW-Bacteroidetes-14]|jgi:tetratricopeptide (TPR) repeat protein|nr:MAG: choloylglycine hydrolase [Bacteroidetes bacterium HGW-Bacteroidetes-14]